MQLKIVLKGLTFFEKHRLEVDPFFRIMDKFFRFVDPILMMPIQWNGKKKNHKIKVNCA